jgi:hypothetical protein
MENKLFDNLKNKQISESSLNLYLKNIIRLNDGEEIKNFNFLKNTTTILDKIKDYKPNTRRTYLISIVSLLKQEPKFASLYDKYYKVLMEYNKDLKTNNDKSEKQTENWITQEEVLNKQKELMSVIVEIKKKITMHQYYKLLNLVVLSLYTLQAPRRNLDYLKMCVINKYSPELSTENNYLDLSSSTFIFRNFKTKKTYLDQVIPVSPELMAILKIYLKNHPLKKDMKGKFCIPLLVDLEGNSFNNSNEITRILNKIFGKKIGSSMLRNIYLTSKYANNLKNLQEDADNMGTSTSTAQNQYIKTDDKGGVEI